MAMEIDSNYRNGYVNSYAAEKTNGGSSKKVAVEKSDKKDSYQRTADYYSELQKKFDCMKSRSLSVFFE